METKKKRRDETERRSRRHFSILLQRRGGLKSEREDREIVQIAVSVFVLSSQGTLLGCVNT